MQKLLATHLDMLGDELDRYLASEHGVDANKPLGSKMWRESHHPFHWFVEFYEIIKRGGFDVIIGNPPYVEYKDISSIYQVKNFKTEDCGNLFAYVVERCNELALNEGRVGMIIPLSAFSTDRMIPFISEVKNNSAIVHIANFSWRPGKLFEGVNLQLSIVLQKIGKPKDQIYTSNYLLWDSEARPELFSKVQFAIVEDERLAGAIPKLGGKEAHDVITKIRQKDAEISDCFTRTSKNLVFYRRGGLYWKVFVDFETESSEEKIIALKPDVDKHLVIAALSSNLWFWYLIATSDCRHLGNRDINTFPFNINSLSPSERQILSKLGKSYVADLRGNAQAKTRVYKGKKAVKCLSFEVKRSKSIIDEIDRILAKHYGFTDEELDFIINYDIKYRMGSAEAEGNGDE